MRILFMGTPDIAAVCLKKLLDDGFDIVGAVTQPDKPKGRGQKLAPPEVKALAQERGIPVYQPERLKNGELQPVLEELRPELIAVVAYGKILPQYVLDAPKFGCINMHASLLPKYRGAAPVQWAVINGEQYTGVTTMKMDEGLDTGDMLLSERLEIGMYETSAELFERIAVLGAKVLAETIRNIETIIPIPQEHSAHTYAPMIRKEMGRIDWNQPPKTIVKLICGMNSWPLAYTHYKGEQVKILSARLSDEIPGGACGRIVRHDQGKGLLVSCKDGAVYIQEVQFAGKKRMHIDAYLLGHTMDMGAILE